MPPFDPAQVHDHGPEPMTELAVPMEHRFVIGIVGTIVLFTEPHTPFIEVGVGAGAGARLLPPPLPLPVPPPPLLPSLDEPKPKPGPKLVTGEILIPVTSELISEVCAIGVPGTTTAELGVTMAIIEGRMVEGMVKILETLSMV